MCVDVCGGKMNFCFTGLLDEVSLSLGMEPKVQALSLLEETLVGRKRDQEPQTQPISLCPGACGGLLSVQGGPSPGCGKTPRFSSPLRGPSVNEIDLWREILGSKH